jgi:tungstate transport system ATP-binding protein
LDLDELEIRAGELLTIVGPNGAGKSTLLRILHFLEVPDEGDMQFDGQDINHPVSLDLRRRIAMVFQRSALFNGSVKDIILF